MVSHHDGYLTLTVDELVLVDAVRHAPQGFAEQGAKVDHFTRSHRGNVEHVTTVGPARLIRPLVAAGVLTATLGGLIELGPNADTG